MADITSTLIPMLQKEIESFTKWQLETLDIIQQLTRSLGWDFDLSKRPVQIKNPDGQTITIERQVLDINQLVENPSINREGVQAVIEHLFSILNKNTILANLTDKEVDELFERHNLTILSELAMNFDRYELRDLATLDKIQDTNEKVSLAVLSRGRAGNTMGYLQPILQFKEALTGNQQDKKLGVF